MCSKHFAQDIATNNFLKSIPICKKKCCNHLLLINNNLYIMFTLLLQPRHQFPPKIVYKAQNFQTNRPTQIKFVKIKIN